MSRGLAGAVVVLVLAALVAGCSKRTSSSDGRARPGGSDRAARTPTPPKLPPSPPGRRRTNRNSDELFRAMEDAGTLKVVNAPGPWFDAKVGEWVKFRGSGGVTMTRKVVKVGEKMATLKVLTTVAGREVSAEIAVPRMVPQGQAAHGVPGGAIWTAETVRVGERRIRCRVATWHKTLDGRLRRVRLHLSDEVPGQMVRSSDVGDDGSVKVVWELVDFGV